VSVWQLGGAVGDLMVFGHDPGWRDARGEGQDPAGGPLDDAERPAPDRFLAHPDIREAELPWLRGQVESMAALPPVDDDGDMPVGLFVLSDERAAVNVWEVHDGMVRDRPAPELEWVFRE
jgi:hypothetical protein